MPEPEDISDVEEESSSPTIIDQTPDSSEAPKAKKRIGLRLGLVVIVALLLVGGGIWLAPHVQEALPGLLPQTASQDPDPRIAGTASQVEKLEARLTELEAIPAPVVEGEDPNLAALTARIEALEARPEASSSEGPSNQLVKNLITRLDGLEGQLKELHEDAEGQERGTNENLDEIRGQMAALNKRLARLKDTPKAGGDFVGAAFFVAVGDLRRQIDQGEPYRREFARLESLTRQGRAVDPVTASYLSILSKHADSGVATFGLLQESYAAVADTVIEGSAPVETGIWQRAWQSIASAVKIRRVGELEGDTPEAVISRAQARLKEGDVAGAVEEMAGLSQPSDAVASWIEAAVAHLQTREALSALEQRGFWGEAAS